MKNKIFFAIAVFSTFSLFCQSPDKSKNEQTLKTQDMKQFIDSIRWFGQSCIKIQFEGKTIYFDPFNLKDNDNADIVFITHGHFDHLSVQDLKKIVSSKTTIIAPPDLHQTLADSGFQAKITASTGKKDSVQNVSFVPVPAYNITKTKFHPKSNNWVGYLVDFGGIKLYHTGDTELVPEMKDIDCNVIFLPLGQTYTMNSVEDAAQAVIDTKAEFAVPFHFGMYEGTTADAEKFRQLLKNKTEVIIKVPEQ